MASYSDANFENHDLDNWDLKFIIWMVSLIMWLVQPFENWTTKSLVFKICYLGISL